MSHQGLCIRYQRPTQTASNCPLTRRCRPLRDRYMISQHPEVEARIVEELRSLDLLATPQQPRPRDLQHSDLSRLIYLTCAIKVTTQD